MRATAKCPPTCLQTCPRLLRARSLAPAQRAWSGRYACLCTGLDEPLLCSVPVRRRLGGFREALAMPPVHGLPVHVAQCKQARPRTAVLGGKSMTVAGWAPNAAFLRSPERAGTADRGRVGPLSNPWPCRSPQLTLVPGQGHRTSMVRLRIAPNRSTAPSRSQPLPTAPNRSQAVHAEDEVVWAFSTSGPPVTAAVSFRPDDRNAAAAAAAKRSEQVCAGLRYGVM
jgi:hypothetical protein